MFSQILSLHDPLQLSQQNHSLRKQLQLATKHAKTLQKRHDKNIERAARQDDMVLLAEEARHVASQRVADLEAQLERMTIQQVELANICNEQCALATLRQMQADKNKSVSESLFHSLCECEKTKAKLEEQNTALVARLVAEVRHKSAAHP
jgi:hypothetical protein